STPYGSSHRYWRTRSKPQPQYLSNCTKRTPKKESSHESRLADDGVKSAVPEGGQGPVYSISPPSFLPWRPKPAMIGRFGTFCSMCPTSAGMLYTTQWVNPPAFGASGSRMVKTKDSVSAGASRQENSGEMSSPSQVN